MNENYGRDFDLNLLRVFVVVAESGSVTRAAASLYLTQPAVSAALKRLSAAVGAQLFTRQHRGLALTSRGQQLLAHAQPHLRSLLSAALSPADFDSKTSDRTIRLGLSDSTEGWLLPPLLKVLEKDAPRMRIIVLPVQFRTVEEALVSRKVEMAITVADEMPSSIARIPLFSGGFVCLFDPKHAHVKKVLSERDYFSHEHVIVSYNGDLRGVVEDVLRKQRRVRCSIPGFAGVGTIVSGTALLATIPARVAEYVLTLHPNLRTIAPPLPLAGTAMELLWLRAYDDDATRFLREKIRGITKEAAPRMNRKRVRSR